MTIQQSIPLPSDATPASEPPARVDANDEQYLEIKAANPGLLLFTGWATSTIVLRGMPKSLPDARHRADQARQHQGMDIPICGVPVSASRTICTRLIEAGHRVAVCEQTENPAAARGPRQQERGPPRRGATGDAGHTDRDTFVGRPPPTLSAGDARARASAAATALALPGIDISNVGFIVTECLDRRTRGDAGAYHPNEVDRYDALYGDAELGRCCANCRR